MVRPLAIDGPNLTIRRFGTRRIPLDALCGASVAGLLRWAVEARANVLVSGGASAGKTTLLNALAAQIPNGERVVTVEDAAELRLPGEHVVRLESRPANAEGIGEVRVRDLVRSALRMRPDRIVVGEIRGGEALDMLQAMNTGHDGSLSTCHANSPQDALRRVETLVLMGDVELPLAAVREQVVAAIDMVVQLTRGADGTRQVTEVGEVERSSDPSRALCVPRADAWIEGRRLAAPSGAVRSGRRSTGRVGPTVSPTLAMVVTGVGAVGLWLAGADSRRLVDTFRIRRRLPATVARPSDRPVAHTLTARARRRRHAESVDRGLPAWLDASVRSARGGASLRHALRDGASIVDESPVGTHLVPFVEALDRGYGLEAALRRLDDGSESSNRKVVERALRLAASVGGPSAAVLDAVSSTLHERAALAREVRALSTQARVSALVMVCAPVMFALGAVQLDSRAAAFFLSSPGVLCVLGGATLDLLGGVWMTRIVRASR